MTDREIMQQALEALELLARYENPATKIQVRKPKDGGPIVTMYPHKVATEAAAPLRERLAQEPNMPEQHVMVGRFMLQPHPENGYWLTDTGTSEGMQIFQPEMERLIKELWKQF